MGICPKAGIFINQRGIMAVFERSEYLSIR